MKLKKLVFEIDGKEVELTKVQAAQLRDEINRILGQPATVAPSWPWPSYPTEPWLPSYPIYGPVTATEGTWTAIAKRPTYGAGETIGI